MAACPTSEVLQRFLQDDLALDRADAIYAHLGVCPSCQQSLERLFENDLLARQFEQCRSEFLAVQGQHMGETTRDLWRLRTEGPAEELQSLAERLPATVGDYTLLQELGRGGMGIVYKAWDRDSNRLVALKTLRRVGRQERRQMAAEFRSLLRLVHRNIVVPDRLFFIDGRACFTMELIEGVPLTKYLRRMSRGAVRAIRPLLKQITDGLCAVHCCGRLHRDVKPSNILVERDGRAVLIDFGLVQEIAACSGHAASPAANGTLHYMAPELLDGQPASPASDWYAVGVILYEVLVGRLPFSGSAEQIVEQKHRECRAEVAGAVSPEVSDLAALCAELLQPAPSHRPCGKAIARRLAAKPCRAERSILSS